MLEKPGESPDDIGKVSYEKVVRCATDSAPTSADEHKATEEAQEAVPPSDTVPEQATEANSDRDLNHNSKVRYHTIVTRSSGEFGFFYNQN